MRPTLLFLLSLDNLYCLISPDRLVWRSHCALMCTTLPQLEQLAKILGPPSAPSAPSAPKKTHGETPMSQSISSSGFFDPLEHHLVQRFRSAHVLLSPVACAHLLTSTLQFDARAASTLYHLASLHWIARLSPPALCEALTPILVALARLPVFQSTLAPRVADTYTQHCTAHATHESVAAAVLIAARSCPSTSWSVLEAKSIMAPILSLNSKRDIEKAMAALLAWAASVHEEHVLGNLLRVRHMAHLEDVGLFAAAVELISSSLSIAASSSSSSLPSTSALPIASRKNTHGSYSSPIIGDHPLSRLHVLGLQAGAHMLPHTHTIILSNLARAGLTRAVSMSFSAMQERGAQPSRQAFTSMIDAFSYRGNFEGAWRVLIQVSSKQSWSHNIDWNRKRRERRGRKLLS